MFDLNEHSKRLHGSMRVAIDCDGVMLDLERHWLNTLNSAFPSAQADASTFAACTPKRDRVPGAEAYEGILEPRHAKYMHSVMSDADWWRYIPSYMSAASAIEHLRTRPSVDVVALTAPYKNSHGWADERTRRLQGEFGFEQRDILFCPSKHKHKVACGILIEDSVMNVEDWVANWNIGGASRGSPLVRAYVVVRDSNRAAWLQSPISSSPWDGCVILVATLKEAVDHILSL